jgi:glyoxylase-like metal-dependent hydrolase (beta-lactamase superfamily II)
MKLAAAAAAWLLLTAMQAPPAPQPGPLAMWRLDCGRILEEDEGASPWNPQPMPVACFLIRHGERYMLWDAGISARALGNAHPTLKLDRTIADQLAQIGVRPEQIAFVGISHYHGDHTGQASAFPRARLLIGAADLEALRRDPPPGGAAPTHLAPWLTGGSPVSALTEDLDVFGDGSVVVLMTPGHTPGHTSLLVKLPRGNVILSGDLWATHENVLRDTMPDFNTSRAETAASRERIRRIADRLDATLILQHEALDVARLPVFPEAAG